MSLKMMGRRSTISAGDSMKLRLLAAAALVAVLLGACATVPPSQNENRVGELIGMINEASVRDLVEQSHVPFFFDAELLVRAADVELMWDGLRSAGFQIVPSGFALEPAAPADFRRIASTFDMESFFSPDGYFPGGAGWLVADSSIGQVLVLLGEKSGRTPVIYGIARTSHE